MLVHTKADERASEEKKLGTRISIPWREDITPGLDERVSKILEMPGTLRVKENAQRKR